MDDFRSGEVHTPVKLFYVQLRCDKCGEGWLESDGTGVEIDKICYFRHICSACGDKVMIPGGAYYPHFECREIGSGNVFKMRMKDVVCE